MSAEKIKNWYARNERPLSTAALVGGFIFDSFTLRRIDFFFEQLWITIQLVMVATVIFLLNLNERGRLPGQVPGRLHFWLLIIIQFAFGNLFSALLVFYFRSATLATSWPFLLLLVIAFIGNESLRQYYARLSLQLSMFFVSLFAFTIFVVPIFLHQISAFVFVLSGILSLAIIVLFILALRYIARERFQKSRAILWWAIGGIFIFINILYFTNLIPPIPLSLKEGGVYHSIAHDTQGNYVLRAEQTGWLNYFRRYPVFHKAPNDAVYVFSAVFSPTDLDTVIVHHWQYFNETEKEWMSISHVTLPITGGRDRGYRTYSYRNTLQEGRWRVDVETPRGQDIGRIAFRVINVADLPVLITERY